MIPFTRQCTAFVDLLGFKEALKDRDRLNKILDLQQMIQGNAGNYQSTNIPGSSGATQVRAAFSAFSDHFLISFPSDDTIPLTNIPALIAFYASSIAAAALKINMLIRGGLCEGDLYHQGHISFGPALVDAYDIESRQAFYPRIVIAAAFVAKLGQTLPWFCFRDTDGSICVDYVAQMIITGADTRGNQTPAEKRTAMLAWVEEARQLAQHGLSEARRNNNGRASQNWQYFAADLERAVSEAPHLR